MKLQSKSKTLTISLPAVQYDQLELLAKKDERSKNYFIRKALDNYLEDVYFSKRAEEILDSGITKTYSLDEIRKKYDL
jgi:predicted DNA-binding protein